MKHWLLKSEPTKYPLSKLKADGTTFWDGVRNYQARNNLKTMAKGDLCIFYHSNEGKEIVGLARVVKEAYQDPTTDDANWVVVDLAFEEEFPKRLTLADIKIHPVLKNMELVRLSRISVVAVQPEEFDLIIKLTH